MSNVVIKSLASSLVLHLAACCQRLFCLHDQTVGKLLRHQCSSSAHIFPTWSHKHAVHWLPQAKTMSGRALRQVFEQSPLWVGPSRCAIVCARRPLEWSCWWCGTSQQWRLRLRWRHVLLPICHIWSHGLLTSEPSSITAPKLLFERSLSHQSSVWLSPRGATLVQIARRWELKTPRVRHPLAASALPFEPGVQHFGQLFFTLADIVHKVVIGSLVKLQRNVCIA